MSVFVSLLPNTKHLAIFFKYQVLREFLGKSVLSGKEDPDHLGLIDFMISTQVAAKSR